MNCVLYVWIVHKIVQVDNKTETLYTNAQLNFEVSVYMNKGQSQNTCFSSIQQ